MNEINSRIGQNIREIRKQRKLTLPELAERARITKSAVSIIENGKGNPTIETLVTQDGY